MRSTTPSFLPFCLVTFLLTFSAIAQQSPAVVGSTVTGRVICADTEAPARFGKVLLKSIEPDNTGANFMKSIQDAMHKAAAKSGEPIKPPTEEQKHTQAAAARSMNAITDMLNSSTIGFDGSYSFAGVKPGTYYVHAIFSGYIDAYSNFTDEDFASTDPAVRARIAQLPTVTVSGTDSAHVDLRLERGAAVSGRILFDDGSPAVGWTLSLVKPNTPGDPAEATTAAMSQALSMSTGIQIAKTDDRGRYRMAGMNPGTYVVRAGLIATPVGISASNMGDGGSGINLAVFTGNTFSRSEAKSITITAGEERDDVDITVPARSLHNLTGHVLAQQDGHTLNIGQVGLTSKSDPSLHLRAAIRDDGSFHFEYLPGGLYTVTVEDAAEGRTTPGKASVLGISIPRQEILHKYGTAATDVSLSDDDINSISLIVAQTNWTPSAKKPDSGPTLGGLIDGLTSPPASSDTDTPAR